MKVQSFFLMNTSTRVIDQINLAIIYGGLAFSSKNHTVDSSANIGLYNLKLNSHSPFDMWVGIIVFDCEIGELEFKKIRFIWIDF